MALNAGSVEYRITGDTTGVNNALDQTEDKAKQVGNAIKGLLAALGTYKAVEALADLTKQCVESYAEFEQLTGGVETLFKTSADAVKQYAQEAYQTAGISANEYMQTVTSFSASMIASLGGDTQKAAELSNQALIDMSDNANKMGTDFAAVQNAYQGFAKQNYTLLDNLKLGYGGTKTEMERLLKDAQELQKQQGITADYSIERFSDIVEAIHVVQTSMDITGTTAKEAATTISGSIGSMKAAWANLLTGFADADQDVQALISQLTDSLNTVVSNVLPVLTETITQLPGGLVEIAETVLPAIPELVNSLLPVVLDGCRELVGAVLDTVGTLGADLIGKTPELIEGIVGIITTVGERAVAAVGTIADSIGDNAADIVLTLIRSITGWINGSLPEVLRSAIQIAENLVTGIIDTLMDNNAEIVGAVDDVCTAIIDAFFEILPDVVNFAIDLVAKLADTLIEQTTDAENLGKLSFAFAKLGWHLCSAIATGIVDFDWAGTIANFNNKLADLLESAQKNVQVLMDNLFTGGSLYGGDVNNVETSPFIENMREGTEILKERMDENCEEISEKYHEGLNVINDALDTGEVLTNNPLAEGVEQKADEIEQAAGELDEAVDTLNEAQHRAEASREASIKAAAGGKEGLEGFESQWDVITHWEKESFDGYWIAKKDWLEKHKEDSEWWWKEYHDIEDHFADEETKRQKEKDDQEKERQKKEKEAQENAKKQEQARLKAISDAEAKARSDTQDAMDDLENRALHEGWDDQTLLDAKREYIEKNLDHNSKLYRDYDTKLLKEQQTLDKKIETEKERAAEQAKRDEEKRQREEEQAARQAEAELKARVQDEFRELETKQLEEGLSDNWLLEKKKAFIETLDHNTEVYKEYHLNLLKEEQKQTDAIGKEVQKQAEKQEQALKKAFENVLQARDKLADSTRLNTSSLFKSTSGTDPRTGATDTENSLQIEEFKKQIAAKKQLPAKLAKLIDKGLPDSLAKELLKLDPRAALEYCNELLNNGAELKDLISGYKADESISMKLADMVTQNSEEFKSLGAELGDTFGGEFVKAFETDWESACRKIFSTPETVRLMDSSVHMAGQDIARTVRTPAVYDTGTANVNSMTYEPKLVVPEKVKMIVVNADGKTIAELTNAEDLKTVITTGS